MGSGLLWAGLGEGIAKAGASIGAYMGKGIEEDWKEERDAQRQEAAERRQAALEVIKEQMAEKKATFLAKQDADTATKVEATTEDVLKSKGFQKFKSDLGQTDATDEQLAKIYSDQYHDKTVTQEPGGDRYDIKDTARAQERVNQARNLGASSGMLKSYAEDASAARKDEKEAENRKLAERKMTETERHNQVNEDLRNKQTLAVISRASSGGGKDPSTTVQSVRTDADGNLIAVMRDGTIKDLGSKSADFNKNLAKIVSDMEKADVKVDGTRFSKLPEDKKREVATQRLLGSDAPVKTDVPAESPTGKTDKPAESKTAAPKVIDSLPKGAVVVGTTKVNGVTKNVYQDPVTGKKYID